MKKPQDPEWPAIASVGNMTLVEANSTQAIQEAGAVAEQWGVTGSDLQDRIGMDKRYLLRFRLPNALEARALQEILQEALQY